MARKGLPGKYIKQASAKGPKKTMMARAWRLYKAAKKKMSRGKKKSNPVAKKKTTSATKKKSGHNPGNPGTKRGVTMKTLVSPKTVRMITDTGFVAGGLVTTTLAMKKIPVLEQWKWWQKSLAQAVVGIIGMAAFIKYKWLFLLFSGTLTGAVATALLEVIPAQFKGRSFTSAELKQLQEGIKNHNRGRTGIPYNYAKKNNLGVPITNLNLMGSCAGGVRRPSH